jgi:hypothetical protein
MPEVSDQTLIDEAASAGGNPSDQPLIDKIPSIAAVCVIGRMTRSTKRTMNRDEEA